MMTMNTAKSFTTITGILALMLTLVLSIGASHAASAVAGEALDSPGILLQSDGETTGEEEGEKKKEAEEEEPDC